MTVFRSCLMLGLAFVLSSQSVLAQGVDGSITSESFYVNDDEGFSFSNSGDKLNVVSVANVSVHEDEEMPVVFKLKIVYTDNYTGLPVAESSSTVTVSPGGSATLTGSLIYYAGSVRTMT